MFRIHTKEFLILWIMSTIMLTTVFMPLGLPAIAGPFVLGVGWLIIVGAILSECLSEEYLMAISCFWLLFLFL